MVSCTPHRVPHSGHSKCCPGTCSSRSSKRFGSPSKRHSPTRHFGSKPSAAVKSSSGVITATKLRIGFCAIATQESSKRLFLQKSDSYPLRNLEQRSRSKRNKWRGPPSAAREGRRPLPGSAPDSSKGAPTDPDAPVSGMPLLEFTVLLPVTICHCHVTTFVNDSEFISCFPVAVP